MKMASDLLNCELLTTRKKTSSEVAHSYPTRSEVEKANNTRLAQIIENPVSFCADDRPGLDEEGNPRVSFQEMERLLDRLVALPTVVLKVFESLPAVTFTQFLLDRCTSNAHQGTSSVFVPAQSLNWNFRTLCKAVWLMDPLVR